jgi:cobalt-zinc-cadmium efflux system outer membrane protein
MKRFLFILFTFNIGLNAAGPLKDLSLEKAIEIALKSHPSLAEAEAHVEIAKARADAAGRLPNPDAVARMESAPFSSTTSRAEYVGGVSQTIPIGGRLSAARKAELAGVATRSHELDAVKFELTRTVRNAFATALFISEVLEIQTNNAASLRELVRITKARAEAGDVNALDVARIESEEAWHRLEVREASRLHHVAMDGLASAMGDFRTPIESLAGSLDDTLQITAIRAASFADDHPTVRTAESEIKAQEARVKLAKAERIPDVNLDLLYRRLEASRENAFDVGVRIPIPLFDRKKRVRQAEQELRATEARLERVRNHIGHEQHELELELESALEAVELLKKEVLPKSEKALRGAEARYKGGDIGLAELLVVRREHATARLRYAETLRVVMSAWSSLRGSASR